MKPLNFYFGRKREEVKEESGEVDLQGSTEVAHASTAANASDANNANDGQTVNAAGRPISFACSRHGPTFVSSLSC